MHNLTHSVAENGVSDMARRQISEHTKTQSHTLSRRKRCIGYGPETDFGTHNAQSHTLSRRKWCIGYGPETDFGTHKDTITHTQSQKTVYRIWPGDRFRNTQCTISQSQKKVMAISLMFNCAILPITTNFKLLDYLRPYPISRCKIFGKRPYQISRCKIQGSYLFYIAHNPFRAS